MFAGDADVVHEGLADFAADVFAPLPRSDQRAKAELYLRGLMLSGGRKSMQPMAERLGIDHQALQQFVTSSTWDVTAVRARLARRAAAVLRPVAWVVGEASFLKDGAGSPCVARQYVRARGRVANCQLGVSVHLVGQTASTSVNWRLFMPKSWDDTLAANPAQGWETARRRRRCGIPDSERHRPAWVLALRMLDELVGWGLRPNLVVAGPGYADNAEFRAALDRRRLPCPTQPDSDVVAGAVIRPAELHRRLENGQRELTSELGLDHFEGRSWIGWNRHVTLVSAAQLFLASTRENGAGAVGKNELKTA